MASASAGRAGRPWRRARTQVLAASTVCWLCGHEGSGEADHDPPLSVLRALGLDPDDPQHLLPAHGTRSRCWTCNPVRGKACNQVRGNRGLQPQRVTSQPW